MPKVDTVKAAECAGDPQYLLQGPYHEIAIRVVVFPEVPQVSSFCPRKAYEE